MQKRSICRISIPLAVLISIAGCSSSNSSDHSGASATAEYQGESVAPALSESHLALSRSALSPTGTAPYAAAAPNALPADAYVIPENRERYAAINTNPVVVTTTQPTSTFSVDVDSGSYANVRRFLNAGQLPPPDAVRVEEMINYFSYDYPVPESTDVPFSINTEVASNPWNENTHLLQIGLKAYEVAADDRPAANLVFLIDVSGSMSDANKLGLVKPALKMLSNQLTEQDSVSIAVYAGASGTVLEPTPGSNQQAIATAIDALVPGGSTNGRAGIDLAYNLAAQNFKDDGVNRVILVTDGDFNVGYSDVDKLKQLIEEKRRSGIALTTLGFGTGNYNDELMEQLADAGNGHYAYIDTLNEARKVLADEAGSTLLTVAKDVKIQVEFNPAVVSEYRLIGYENRHLANEDFSNDKVDAGDIGAGHTVTALYEVALVGQGGERNTDSRYSINSAPRQGRLDEIADVRLRYKMPNGSNSQVVSKIVKVDDITDRVADTSTNFRFATAVAAMGQQLRGGKYLKDYSSQELIDLALAARGEDGFGYRQEFISLVRLAEELDNTSGQALSRIPPEEPQKGPRG